MFRFGSQAALAAVCVFASGCDNPAPETGGGEHATSQPSAPAGAAGPVTESDVAAVWPASGTKVFSTFDLLVGLPGQSLDGRVAVLANGEPVAAGTAVDSGEGVWLLPAGQNYGELTLPAGKHDLCVQVLDGESKSKGPGWSAQVSYEVVADPTGGRKVSFIEPQDGATIGTKFKAVFGVEGMGMSPAGENAGDHTVGHHHVLVNGGPMPPGTVVPNDATHLHYGKAQTEAEIELEPGTYELTMQFADAGHRSYGARMATTIKVTVQ